MSDENEGHREAEGRDEAEEMARLQEQINNLPVSEHIVFMMHSLSSLAVDRLGLVPEGAARLDVSQARLAIEAFKALLGVLEEAIPTEAVAAHRGVLSQLQLAYVGALGSAPAARAESEAASPAPEARGGQAPAPAAALAGDEAPTKEKAPAPKKAAPKKAAPKKASKPRSGAPTKGDK